MKAAGLRGGGGERAAEREKKVSFTSFTFFLPKTGELR